MQVSIEYHFIVLIPNPQSLRRLFYSSEKRIRENRTFWTLILPDCIDHAFSQIYFKFLFVNLCLINNIIIIIIILLLGFNKKVFVFFLILYNSITYYFIIFKLKYSENGTQYRDSPIVPYWCKIECCLSSHKIWKM